MPLTCLDLAGASLRLGDLVQCLMGGRLLGVEHKHTGPAELPMTLLWLAQHRPPMKPSTVPPESQGHGCTSPHRPQKTMIKGAVKHADQKHKPAV